MKAKAALGYIAGLASLVAGYFLGTTIGNFMDKLGYTVMHSFGTELALPTRGSVVIAAIVACVIACYVNWCVTAKEKKFSIAIIYSAIVIAIVAAFTVWKLSELGIMSWWYLGTAVVIHVIYCFIVKKYDPIKEEEAARAREDERKRKEREALFGADADRNGEKPYDVNHEYAFETAAAPDSNGQMGPVDNDGHNESIKE